MTVAELIELLKDAPPEHVIMLNTAPLYSSDSAGSVKIAEDCVWIVSEG